MRRLVAVPLLGLGAASATWFVAEQSGVEASRRIGAVVVLVAAVVVVRALDVARELAASEPDASGPLAELRPVDRFVRYEALAAKIGWASGSRGDARSILGPVVRAVATDVQSGRPGERLERARAALGDALWAQLCGQPGRGTSNLDLADLEVAVDRLERLEAEWR